MSESSPEKTDGELVAAILDGRRDQFAHLVDRYQAALMRLAFSRLERADWAEEAVQETFFCAFKSLHCYNSKYSFRTWLWTILLNQCKRQYTRRARRSIVSVWSEQPESVASAFRTRHRNHSADDGPHQRLLAKERSQLLDALLAQIPITQADALRLRFFGGLKFAEIACAMGCGLSTAKNRVGAGLKRLSEIIRNDSELIEVFSQPAITTHARNGDES